MPIRAPCRNAATTLSSSSPFLAAKASALMRQSWWSGASATSRSIASTTSASADCPSSLNISLVFAHGAISRNKTASAEIGGSREISCKAPIYASDARSARARPAGRTHPSTAILYPGGLACHQRYGMIRVRLHGAHCGLHRPRRSDILPAWKYGRGSGHEPNPRKPAFSDSPGGAEANAGGLPRRQWSRQRALAAPLRKTATSPSSSPTTSMPAAWATGSARTAPRRARPTRTCCATSPASTACRRCAGRARSAARRPGCRRPASAIATPLGVVVGGDMTDDGGGQVARSRRRHPAPAVQPALPAGRRAGPRPLSRSMPASAITTSTRTARRRTSTGTGASCATMSS